MELDFKKIKLIVSDFDGVFTDNKVLVDENGKESVFCNRGDGLGIELLKKKTNVEKINQAFLMASREELRGILDYNEEPLVSKDYNGNSYSSIVDGLSTMMVDGNLAKIIAWYDNEWAYSCRIIDLAKYIWK